MNFNLIFNTNQPTLYFAAEELGYYFKRIDTTISFSFNTASEDCFNLHLITTQITSNNSDDIYTISCTGSNIHLTGNNERSILLASYKLLYLMGCRFLQPGRKYEYIPQIALHTFLPTFIYKKTYTASYKHRGVCIEGANAIENVTDFIDWLPKLGYNAFFMQFKSPYTFFERWYHHTLNPLLEKEQLSLEQVDTFTNHIEQELQKRSLMYHKVGHGWTCETLGVEDLGWQKVDSHPDPSKKDWVALLNGKRSFFGGIPTNTNLCYSNPNVKEAFVQTILHYTTQNPNIDYLHIWLADEYNNLCECDACKDNLLADQYVSILNQLDEELTKRQSPVKIVFLIYQELLWPPLKEAFKNHNRFTLMFAPISRTFEKSYQNCTLKNSIPNFVRNQIKLPTSLEENLSFLSKWQEKWTGDSFVYDYPLGRAHYGDAGYLNISKIISQDIKHLKSMGLNGYISCQELRASFPNSLPNYIMGLTLFDADTNFNTIVDDYFTHLYGNQKAACLKYLQSISDSFSCDYFNGLGERISSPHANAFLGAIKEADAFQHTLQLENTSYFAKKLYFHTQYVKLLAPALNALASGDTVLAQEIYIHFAHFIRTNELAFQESLDVYRVIEVSSKYTGFKPLE